MTVNVPEKPKSALPLIVRVLRNKFVQTILSSLEEKTRNNMMESDGAQIVRTNKLTPELLKDFFENKVLAIHMPGFCPPEIAEHTANNILKKQLHNWNIRDAKTGYKESDVEVFGTPFTDAIRSDSAWNSYFSGAKKLADELHELSAPYQYPLDKFRNEMDELWPEGFTVKTYKGAKMVPGLVRVMHDKPVAQSAEASLGCHVDDTPIISPNHGKFSVNIYLKPAKQGGNLFVWNSKISSLKEFFSRWYLIKNFFLESNYQNEELQKGFQSMLPEPFEIKVAQGDLVLINTGRPHAVSGYSGGPRVSIQAFITYEKGKALQVWA